MAVPVEATDRSIFVVAIKMGSPNQSKGRDIDEFVRELTYKKPKGVRLQIGNVRQSVNVAIQGTCMKFYGTKITNQAGKETLERECTLADRRMKDIDSSLHVTPVFFEVKVSSMSAGNMFDQMKEQLSVQVHERVLERIKKVLEEHQNPDGTYKPVSGKTRTALLTMLDKLMEINVLNDDNVTAQITAMRSHIQSNSLIPLRDEILAYIEEVQGENSLELTPDIPAPVHDPDEEEFKPRVLSDEENIHLDDLL